MNSKVLLISEKQIKDKSIIEDNVDGKMLSTIISNVQATQVKAILRNDLYIKLIDEIEQAATDEDYTMSIQINELWQDYVIPFLSYAVLVEILIFNNYKITNKGVMKFNDNSASSIGQGELENVKNYYENYLATYKNNLINFLKSQSLSKSGTDKDTTSYATGWYLD